MSLLLIQRSLLFAGIWVLSLCSALPTSNSDNVSPAYEYSRDPKTLMYFPFVKLVIPPEPCGTNANTNNNGNIVREGVCLPPGGCKAAMGTVIPIDANQAKCNNGFGECCSINAICTADLPIVEVKEYVTILKAPTPSNTQCSFLIRRKKDVCQVRLDFITYSSPSADIQGNCQESSLRIGRTVSTPNSFSTCGNLQGQHMYLTYGAASDTIEVTPRISNGEYKIVATQIPCYSKRIAPNYCLQYYTKGSDVVKSFDFGGQQQNNQRYTICVQNSEQSDTINWRQCTTAEAGVTASNPPNTFSIKTIDPIVGLQAMCAQDWVQVNGYNRVCGTGFPAVNNAPKPFNLNVNFDAYEAPPPPVPFDLPTNSTSCPGFSSPPNLDCVWDMGTATCQCVAAVVAANPTNPLAVNPDIGNQGFCLRYST